MKKLIIKIPLSSIVLIVFAFISFVWANQQKGMTADETVFDEIVVLENAEYDEENEGKQVAVYSDLFLTKAPVDPDTGLSVKCGILVKNVEMYQYTIDNDAVYKKYLGYSEKNIKGLHGEKYNNVEFPAKYRKNAVLGKACIGDGKLMVGDDLLRTLVKNRIDGDVLTYQKLNPDFEIPGFKKDSTGTFTNSEGDKPKIGDLRISYYYLTFKSLGKVLIVGRQQGNEIVASGAEISAISLEAENIEELKGELVKSDHAKTANVLIILAFIELAGAVIIGLVSKIKSKKSGRVY